MTFILGIAIGLLLAHTLFLGYIYFQLKGKNKIHETMRKVEQKARPQVKIIMPPTEMEEAQEEVISRNSAQGRDTSLEEIV